MDTIGATVTFPFRDGKSITLLRWGTTLQKDGSVSWHGEVQETGDWAVLMLWSNALLTGYFGYKGTVYAVESLGGGVQAFSEMDRGKQPPDHAPAASRDNVPGPNPANRWSAARRLRAARRTVS